MLFLRLVLGSIFIVCCLTTVTNGATLAKDEVEALKSIGKTLGKAGWDFGFDPCSQRHGWVDQSTRYYANNVVCDCSFNNNTICHVVQIDLTRNYLNGTIPPEWGSSTGLISISLLGNRLTGQIPAELANLRNLTSLILENNGLSGILPAELGNLSKIEQLYMEASGLIGPIPSVNVTLLNLTYIIISDLNGDETNFTQALIDASLPKLERLMSRSCNLIGEIPASFGTFTSIKILGIVPCLRSQTTCTAGFSHSVHINCGGEITKFNGINYNADNNQAGPSTFQQGSRNWAFGTTGVFLDGNHMDDVLAFDNRQVSISGDGAELYRNARLAVGDLGHFIRMKYEA
ncbi:probable leucine-rich repeat receptor-like serine/threonine-protein kinase At3g14840 [Gossypium hirsutum]|uniref:Probable leucine-rich repeat receptor-like serine/threonine-protein kinase At3g14840 n=1 Tax=Gossypium hirsutum TaxID=3635 RepID=A0ABM2Z6T4_GOSHI|nr:probable leucine-rich repeat receptor-like serine/threonine-protein kinase At3g14840 [Gossypium hirsutum]